MPEQRGDHDTNALEPIIENITDLCDFCVRLTEAMVTVPREANMNSCDIDIEGTDSIVQD